MSAGRRVNTKSQDWCTPPKYIEAVRRFFNGRIDLDPCSNANSIVGADVEFKLPDHDGLVEEWTGKFIYVNPPYGKDKMRGTTICDWMKKCADSYLENGSEVVALVPVATNTRHWKEYVFNRAACICFLSDTRLKFLEDGVESKKGAPMACALVYWGDRTAQFRLDFSPYGAIVDVQPRIARCANV